MGWKEHNSEQRSDLPKVTWQIRVKARVQQVAPGLTHFRPWRI